MSFLGVSPSAVDVLPVALAGSSRTLPSSACLLDLGMEFNMHGISLKLRRAIRRRRLTVVDARK